MVIVFSKKKLQYLIKSISLLIRHSFSALHIFLSMEESFLKLFKARIKKITIETKIDDCQQV
ncbi:hypothetical protein BpHYR1_051873 [Brachionus plicatilis]|uniref:Uncharacterized protein n=1 Tax=Brachionus plicatilis TaxID=10195 RepID=A0A3M7REY9_BRAPC|nr:hypothetical protein BpHYR1_051873 [Brachionus plicatilis]